MTAQVDEDDFEIVGKFMPLRDTVRVLRRCAKRFDSVVQEALGFLTIKPFFPAPTVNVGRNAARCTLGPVILR